MIKEIEQLSEGDLFELGKEAEKICRSRNWD
jgi:hypothetical protein